MSKSFYLFAFLCMLSFSNAQDRFLPQEEGELSFECEFNEENEECSWEEEFNFSSVDDISIGKAAGDTGDSQGNTPEAIGAAVHDAIVKVGGASTEGDTASIPSTGDPNADAVITGIQNAIAGLKDDIESGADSLGTEVGNVVTNSLNGAQSSGDVNTAVAGAVSESVAGLEASADQIGDQIGGAVSQALTEIVESNPNAQTSEAMAGLNEASGQVSSIVSSFVKSAAANADAIGSGIGDSVGDAVNEGGSAADVAGNAVANYDQTVKDNAADIADVVANAFGSGTVMDPSTEATMEQIRQDVTNSLEGMTQEGIEGDRAGVSQAVNDAINTVESQGTDPSQNPGAVINALADQIIAAGQSGSQ